MQWSKMWCLGCLVALFIVGAAPQAEAQTDVVKELVDKGQMPRRDAMRVARKISAALNANAKDGGDRYDSMRKAVNSGLFKANPGPGKTREEYESRFKAVMKRMKKPVGMDILPPLFSYKKNATLMCSYRWKLSMQECDAVLAAAKGKKVDFPFVPADGGKALEESLRKSKLNLKARKEVSRKLGATMLGVPSNLKKNHRGALLIDLMKKCPGAGNRTEQVRAWHAGPTEATALCIASSISQSQGDAFEDAKIAFEFSDATAEAFVRWGNPDYEARVKNRPKAKGKGARKKPRVTVIKSADTYRLHAALHQARGNRQFAIRSLKAAIEAEPKDAPTFITLAKIYMKAEDFNNAARYFDGAVQLEPENVAYLTELGRAFARGGKKTAAIRVLQAAVKLQRGYQPALIGLKRLGGDLPPPPPRELPQTPSRDDVIATLSMLNATVSECAPGFKGTVKFKLAIVGQSGDVESAKITSGEFKGTPIGQCMEGVVQGAEFPRFKKKLMKINYPFKLESKNF